MLRPPGPLRRRGRDRLRGTENVHIYCVSITSSTTEFREVRSFHQPIAQPILAITRKPKVHLVFILIKRNTTNIGIQKRHRLWKWETNPKQTNLSSHSNMHRMHHLIHNGYMTFMHLARNEIQGLVVGIQANPELSHCYFLWVSSYLVLSGIPHWVTPFNLLLMRCYPQLSQ